MPSTSKKIIIATGGTGGHLYPGIALARELKERGVDVSFIVKINDAGKPILKNEGFSYIEIPAMGMPRKFSLKVFLCIFTFIKGFIVVLNILKLQKPSAVIGMGGYISFPAITAAYMLGIKTVIHEQNSIPGLANKLLSKIVSKVAISFQQTTTSFPVNKTVLTGNPVRKELFNSDATTAYERFGLSKNLFTVLIFGGSQGAKRINESIIGSLSLLGEIKDEVQFLHIAGKDGAEQLEIQYKNKGFKNCVLSYLETIGDAYAVADLIICRSGATTVAELNILNKTAILVPFPYATADHQVFNAKTMVEALKAVMILEKDLKPEIIAEAIKFRLKSFRVTTKQKPEIPARFAQENLADLL